MQAWSPGAPAAALADAGRVTVASMHQLRRQLAMRCEHVAVATGAVLRSPSGQRATHMQAASAPLASLGGA